MGTGVLLTLYVILEYPSRAVLQIPIETLNKSVFLGDLAPPNVHPYPLIRDNEGT
jgi:hypothetical protein